MIGLTALIVVSGISPIIAQDIFPVPTVVISETIDLTHREPSVFTPNQTFYLLQDFSVTFWLTIITPSANHTSVEAESIIGNMRRDLENNIMGFRVTHGFDELIPPNLTFNSYCYPPGFPSGDNILCQAGNTIAHPIDYINDNGTIFVNTPIIITVPKYLSDPTEPYPDDLNIDFSFYVSLTGLQEITTVDFPTSIQLSTQLSLQTVEDSSSTEVSSTSIPFLFIFLPILAISLLRKYKQSY